MKTTLSDVVLRTSVKCQPEISSEMRWVGADHVDEGDFKVRRWSTTDDPLFPPTFKFRVPAGSVLLHSRNPKKVATLDFDAITGEKFFCLVSADPQVLDSRFLALQLQSSHFAEYVSRWMSGSVNKFLNWSALANYEFELPSLDEQARLVDLLSTLEDHDQSLRELLRSNRECRKAVLRRFFGVNDDVTEWVPLGEICKFDKGISYKSDEIVAAGEGLPFINLKSVERGGGYRTDGIKYFSGAVSDTQMVGAGDLLICCTDLTKEREIVGCPVLVPEDDSVTAYAVSLDLVVLRPVGLSWLNEFLFIFLQSEEVRQFMKSNSRGTTVMHLDVPHVKSLRVPILTPQAQRDLVNEIRCLDIVSEAIAKAQEEVASLRRSVLNRELS